MQDHSLQVLGAAPSGYTGHKEGSLMGDRYPDRLEMTVLDKKLRELTTKAVREGSMATDQALRILRVFRFAACVISHARDRLNRC